MVDFIFKMLELYKYLALYERNKIEKEITIYREEGMEKVRHYF